MRILVATDGSSGAAQAVEWLLHLPLPEDATIEVPPVGSPAQGILREASSGDSDVIVAGACGVGHVERLLMGSVAESVLRHATCPVLIVRSRG